MRGVVGRWGRAAVATVVVLAAVFAGQFLWLALRPPTDPADDMRLWQVVDLVVPFGVSLILLVLWLRLREGRGLSGLGVPVRRRGRAVLGASALAFVVFAVAAVAAAAVSGPDGGGADPAGDVVAPGVTAVVAVLLATALQSSTEELLFRGYLLGAVRTGFGSTAAVAFSSVVFGLCHSFNSGATVVYVATTVALGALLGVLALGRGGLWASCSFHTVWNAVQNVLADPAAGHRDSGASAGEVAFLLTIVCCVVVAVWLRRRRPVPPQPEVVR
ncbi:CPBP family intramembrane metalloprotease [Pseudonocardia sp. DR1-2]|uniref:CPBP family intramembrane glutamic endopeptidase n=1 Tax=Pseudonocardia sp. DR1-2 TaxID=2951168 RepID=UPI0020432379|nr:CPBP family intramembrane glutamic endopeptidase [Pseudonocardia sp. DR1-2]MCM3845653.1 CPBP family intramembrane metalloprotease [Pseudonocardia sp. DR1-2]